jgi:hypothetical protein
MIAIFKCGKCGRNTQMYPQGEPVYEEVHDHVDVEVHEPSPDGKVNVRIEKHPRRRFVQKTYKMRRQNVFTGHVEHIDVGAEDHKGVHKTFQLQLKLGDEVLTKAVCLACYEKHIMPLAEKLWQELAKLRSV